MSKMISVRLDEDRLKQLDEIAKQTGTNRSTVVVAAIQGALQYGGKEITKAQALALIENAKQTVDQSAAPKKQKIKLRAKNGKTANVTISPEKETMNKIAKTRDLQKTRKQIADRDVTRRAKTSRKLAKQVGISSADVVKIPAYARSEKNSAEDPTVLERLLKSYSADVVKPKRTSCPHCGGKLRSFSATMMRCGDCSRNVAKDVL